MNTRLVALCSPSVVGTVWFDDHTEWLIDGRNVAIPGGRRGRKAVER
jgi:hypothetical protein